MAYMTKDGEGPYPNKAGEYCGNHRPKSPMCRGCKEARDEAEQQRKKTIAMMRYGMPRACKAGTIKEMEEMGYVGLYLREDQPLRSLDSVEVDTPEDLKEPKEEERDQA